MSVDRGEESPRSIDPSIEGLHTMRRIGLDLGMEEGKGRARPKVQRDAIDSLRAGAGARSLICSGLTDGLDGNRDI